MTQCTTTLSFSTLSTLPDFFQIACLWKLEHLYYWETWRLLVKAPHRNVTEAKIFIGFGKGETVFIPRITLILSDYSFQFKRLQFPVKTCFAMTINKVQRQSLNQAGVDLREDCFFLDQLYLDCLGVSSPNNLVVLKPEGKTSNIVYKEVLLPSIRRDWLLLHRSLHNRIWGKVRSCNSPY